MVEVMECNHLLVKDALLFNSTSVPYVQNFHAQMIHKEVIEEIREENDVRLKVLDEQGIESEARIKSMEDALA